MVPKNQNQDTPRMALRTAGWTRAMRSTASDSGSGFQPIFRSGAPASTRGIRRATRLPAMASATIAAAAASGPWAPAIWKIRPPVILPPRIEIEVPIPTRPFPPVSSSGLRMAGSTEYFTGPNRVDRRSVPVERLDDVGRLLLASGVPELPPARPARPERVELMRQAAADGELVEERLARNALAVGRVSYLADVPRKHREGGSRVSGASGLAGLLSQAKEEVLLQTPYLVLSDSAVEIFRELRQGPEPPRVLASTNSLAATDNAIVYALTYK